MEEQEQKNTNRHRCISNIEYRPSRQVVSPDIDVKKVEVKEVNDLPVEQWCILKQQAVEDPVGEPIGVDDQGRKRQTGSGRHLLARKAYGAMWATGGQPEQCPRHGGGT